VEKSLLEWRLAVPDMAKPDAVRRRKDPKIGTISRQALQIGKTKWRQLVVFDDPAD
jgi:hypothetical protein